MHLYTMRPQILAMVVVCGCSRSPDLDASSGPDAGSSSAPDTGSPSEPDASDTTKPTTGSTTHPDAGSSSSEAGSSSSEPDTGTIPDLTKVHFDIAWHADAPVPATAEGAWPEAPPWLIAGGWRQYFFSNGRTFMCSHPESIIPPAQGDVPIASFDGCGLTHASALSLLPDDGPLTGHWNPCIAGPGMCGVGGVDPDLIARYPDDPYLPLHVAGRSYDAAFSVHAYRGADEKDYLFSINHDENKNSELWSPTAGIQVGPGCYYRWSSNSLRPDIAPERGACGEDLCASTNTATLCAPDSGFAEYWPTYYGFVTGSWNALSEDTGWGASEFLRMGPLVWPRYGFINADGDNTGGGLRHPTGIRDGEFLYLFYLDDTDASRGIKIARAHVPDGLGPGGWRVYDSTTDLFSEPGLPEGYEIDKIREFFTAWGPQAEPIPETGLNENTQRFAVARIRQGVDGHPAFLGVQTDNMWDGHCQISFRLAPDLVHWTPRNVVWTSPDFNQCRAQYLILSDKAGSTNEEIDLEEFYLVGGAFDGRLQFFRVTGTL